MVRGRTGCGIARRERRHRCDDEQQQRLLEGGSATRLAAGTRSSCRPCRRAIEFALCRRSRGQREVLPSRYERRRGQTVATYDLTRLDMDDLDEPFVRHLLTVGEPLHVERKRDLPAAEQLSELLGSMGNTEGGWALLGVEDDGTVVGLKQSNTDLQDAIRDRVQSTLDPLPNFAARRLTVDGVEIGIVRIYPSEDTPLVSTHKGSLYIRLPGGKRPVNSRRELDQLLQRGRASTRDARERLVSSTVVATALCAPELSGASSYEESPHREWVLRAAPVGLDPYFDARVRTQAVKKATEHAAQSLLPPPPNGYGGDEWAELLPVSPGWITWGQRMSDPGAGAIVVDPAGVVAAVARERGQRTLINIEDLIEQTIIPLLAQAMTVLAAAGVAGRLLCDLHGRGFHGVVLQAIGQGNVQMAPGTRRSQPHRLSTTSDTDELRATAERLMADIASDAGLLTFT